MKSNQTISINLTLNAVSTSDSIVGFIVVISSDCSINEQEILKQQSFPQDPRAYKIW